MKVKTAIVITIEDAHDLTERDLDIMENAIRDLKNLETKDKDEEKK
jgi:hypothetical protein